MFLSMAAAVQVVNKEHSLDFLSITDKFRILNENVNASLLTAHVEKTMRKQTKKRCI